MRIISGTHKGKRITAPKTLPSRPTTDMAKEALFNILNHQYYLEELTVLDLFSGTGNISYEFASRGSNNITCIDSNYQCIKFINKTSKELNFNLKIIKSEVFTFLKNHKNCYDIIFADPPYSINDKDLNLIVQQVFSNNLLKQQGLLIIEHTKDINLTLLDKFSFNKRYGGSVFSFFE